MRFILNPVKGFTNHRWVRLIVEGIKGCFGGVGRSLHGLVPVSRKISDLTTSGSVKEDYGNVGPQYLVRNP